MVHASQFTCDMCGKTFGYLVTMQRHKKNLHFVTNLKYKCDICDKTFKYIGNLHIHFKIHNRAKLELVHCDICQKGFHAKESLQRHQKTHLKIVEYNCNICHRKFTEEGNLKRHFKIHKIVHCDICYESFNGRSLDRHKKLFHGNGQLQLYSCDVCEKTFREIYHLKRHSRIHF